MSGVGQKILVSVVAIAFYVTLAVLPQTSSLENQSASGINAWRNGDMESALKHFRNESRKPGWSSEKQYNLGTALAGAALQNSEQKERVRQLSVALINLGRASGESGSGTLRALALYNQGTIELLSDNLDESIVLLRRALLVEPANENARTNLELAYLARRNQEEQLRSRDSNSVSNTGGKAKGNSTQNNQTQEYVARDEKSQSGTGREEIGPIPTLSGGDSNVVKNMDSGSEKGVGNSHQEQPKAVLSFGQSPVPRDPEDLALQQKLDALERRSGQLRRAGLLQKSSDRAQKFRNGKD